MRGVALLLAGVTVCSASLLEFVTTPKSLRLPSMSMVSEVRLSQLAELNANLLGLTAEPIQGFDSQGDLFSRPRAIAVVQIDGIDSLNNKDHTTYPLENDRFDPSPLNEKLATSFGADSETVVVNREGISGSGIAKLAAEQKINDEIIKTKLPILRDELAQIYRLAAAIVAQNAKFEKTNAPDAYRITISGLAGKKLSEEERATAMKDVQNAITKLTNAMTTAYGDQVIVEVVALSDAVKPTNYHDEPALVRRKRAADMNSNDKSLKKWRELLNVYVFCSTDYPAIFAIFAGLVIALVLAVLYTVVGMMSMDPSKDSIIYRMTTTRMKKA